MNVLGNVFDIGVIDLCVYDFLVLVLPDGGCGFIGGALPGL